MNQKAVLLILFWVFSLHARGEDDKNTVPGVLKSAIVYRNAAELTHSAKATIPKGNSELVIEDISNNIDLNSVRVHCSEAVTIMSVEFSKEYLKPETKSPNLKRLEDSLLGVRKEISKLVTLQKSDNDLLEVLKANNELKGTQTGLSVAELMKLMDYYKVKSLELYNEISGYQEKISKLNELVEKLQNTISDEQKKNSKVTGRITLQLLCALGGSYEFVVSYLTPTAYWKPSYDIRVENIKSPLKLSYKAKLAQTSGLDWKQVKLTLSNSIPNQEGNAPLLKSWFLHFINPVTYQSNNYENNSIQSMSILKKLPGEEMDSSIYNSRNSGFYLRGTGSINRETPLYLVNGKLLPEEEFRKIDPGTIKSVDVLKDPSLTGVYGARASNGVIKVTLKDEMQDYVSVSDNQLNLSFDIDIPYDIQGNGKEQQVVLRQFDVPAFYKYYAVPKLDMDAYLLGELSDWGKLNLLPGEANIMFEGTYVGTSYIEPGSTQDTLNLTLGKDKRVVIKREKINDFSSTKFLGSSKRQDFIYEITVKNNKKEAISLLLKDQYPLSSTKDIETELTESSGAEINPETGVLTWKISLEPGESKKIRIGYTIRYPKDKMVNAN